MNMVRTKQTYFSSITIFPVTTTGKQENNQISHIKTCKRKASGSSKDRSIKCPDCIKKTKPNNSSGQGTSQTNISTTCSDWDTRLSSVKLISLVSDIPNGEVESWQLHRNGFWFACSKGDTVKSFQIHRCATSGRWWGGVKLRDLMQVSKRISCTYRKSTYFNPCNGPTILDVESDGNYFLVQPTTLMNFFRL